MGLKLLAKVVVVMRIMADDLQAPVVVVRCETIVSRDWVGYVQCPETGLTTYSVQRLG